MLREEPAWALAVVAAGPLALAAAAVVVAIAPARDRWRAAAGLAVLLATLDLAFELWVGQRVRVATTGWELVRLGAIAPALAIAARLEAGHGRWLARAALSATGVAALGVALGLGVCLQGAAEGRGAQRGGRGDAALVLGFALDPGGQAAPSLVARVRHAARLYREGAVGRIVLTGGTARGAATSESAVADAIARRAGVPPEAVLREERSQTTAENLREAARIVRRLRCRSVLVVTEPHHVGRAMLLAGAVGLPARPSASTSPLWRLRPAPYWLVREVGYLPAALREVLRARPAPREREVELEIVESAPIETTLDHADLRDAHEVWPALFAKARRTIDLAEFYASNEPASRLETSIRALLAAADRGVRVRFLVEASFARLYPDTLARLDAHETIAVRRLDFERSGAGGILHEKAFIVDGEEAWIGSQNFDWRSLTHIQELGVRVRDPVVAGALADLFESDWARAGGERLPAAPGRAYDFPTGLTLVASPRGFLPDESLWDLPHLVAWIDAARRSVRVQLLTYGDDEGRWPVLGDALRRAAARGVRVQMIVSNWAVRPRPRGALARLASPPGLTVKIATIPPAARGFVPFARVVHAKYMVVDDARAWIGTSNWEREYFLESRNVGLLVERRTIARRLAAFFDGLWRSPYAEVFDPMRAYAAPRIGE